VLTNGPAAISVANNGIANNNLTNGGVGMPNYIKDLSLTAGPGGDNLWKIGELTYAEPQALKQYLAIVAGESGNNLQEAQAIGSVIMNRLAVKGASLEGDFVSKIGGIGQYDAIGGDIYNSIMASSWEDIFNSNNIYATRISGAFSPLVWNQDYSGGAYFWNASSPQTGFNWNCYNNGTFTITNTFGGTTFFKYTNINKTWP